MHLTEEGHVIRGYIKLSFATVLGEIKPRKIRMNKKKRVKTRLLYNVYFFFWQTIIFCHAKSKKFLRIIKISFQTTRSRTIIKIDIFGRMVVSSHEMESICLFWLTTVFTFLTLLSFSLAKHCERWTSGRPISGLNFNTNIA